jgi:SCY1-like protein 1
VPDSQRYAPPEVASSGWDTIRRHPISAPDAYNFGTLIFEAFNGSFSGKEQAGQTKGIPPSMHQSYKRLVNANPKTRLSIGHFLEQGQRRGGFFETLLIRITEGVENLGVKSESEREELLGYGVISNINAS